MTGSSHKNNLNSAWMLLITLGVAVLLRLPVIISSGLTNASSVVLAKLGYCNYSVLTCDPYPSIKGSQIQVDRAKMWLETALKLQPNSSIIRLHLATVLFGLGLRHEAASMAEPLSSYPSGRNPFVPAGRSRESYEYYLLNAQQLAATGRWTEAVRNFRLGLAWGGEQTLPIDLQDFYEAQANSYLEQAQADPGTARLFYLAGKYFVLAGHWSDALPWLKHATEISGGGRLTSEETGRTHVATGQVLEEQGNLTEARKEFEQAISQSSNLREAYVYLSHLLRVQGETLEADRVEAQLAALGPGTNLGKQAVNYHVMSPMTLPGGWTLVGYDLDEERLESGGSIEILLWWENPSGAQMEGEAWTHAGPYWLEWRTVTNMFPNAGFEWGTRQDGIPLGQNNEIYGTTPGSLEVRTVLRNGSDTQALFANNNAKNLNVALESYPIQVDSAGYYLMAGWIWDEAGIANIGRNCTRKVGVGPYYIVDFEPRRPLYTWVHVANLNLAQPGQQPENDCVVLLMNYNTKTTAAWDDILWVPISSP